MPQRAHALNIPSPLSSYQYFPKFHKWTKERTIMFSKQNKINLEKCYRKEIVWKTIFCKINENGKE